MKKFATFLMALCVGLESYTVANGEVLFEAGYRNDTIKWHRSTPAHNPKASYTQKFQDIDIFQVQLRGRANLGCNFYIRGKGYWGWVLEGDFKQDLEFYGKNNYNSQAGIDFKDNDRNIVDHRWVYGINGAIGYPFFFCDSALVLAPVVGYSADVQQVGFDGCCFEAASTGSIGLGSEIGKRKIHNSWYGPFIGFDFQYHPYCDQWNIWGELEYHWSTFEGARGCRGSVENLFDENDRKLRNGHGWLFGLGLDYELCDCWTIGLSFNFQDRFVTKNRHSNFGGFGEGSSDDYCYSSSSGNERSKNRNQWRSYNVNATIGYRF